jgi:hypothetical protein
LQALKQAIATYTKAPQAESDNAKTGLQTALTKYKETYKNFTTQWEVSNEEQEAVTKQLATSTYPPAEHEFDYKDLRERLEVLKAEFKADVEIVISGKEKLNITIDTINGLPTGALRRHS